MIQIKIADLIISIENRYPFVERQCRDYIVENQSADICVSVSEDELEAERAVSEEEFSNGYLESICIYRKICNKLPFYDAFLLHASVVECDGVSYAFSAPSGTGKSTHTRLWLEVFGERARIINGDKPIMRFVDGKLMVFGTPWCGKEGYNINTSSPLAALCFINRAKENKIEKADEAQAVTKLFNQILLPKDEEAVSKLLDLLDRMIVNYPVYELYCNISPEAAEIAHNGMKGETK